ncbi:MAG: hypothetical protein DPW09_20460 [Anaerolineae bacterium]|nr:hypothetical protein [Anaerolineales bacterium]MCK6625394.1 hypothetical protein [Anaerolineae bacterium]MCQ3975816.1 hypothetical protein [Anaerolineae bacterium]
MSHMQIFYKLQQPFFDEEYLVYGDPSWDKEYGRAEWANEVIVETIKCPVYPSHQRAGERIGNLVILLPSGKTADFVWTWYSDCLITDRVLRLFEEAKFTGFTVKPVEVKLKDQSGKELIAPPVLWELVVTGKGGEADPRSGIRQIYACPHCGLKVYSSFQDGVIVNEQTWDGSDFFTITGYQFIIVTERVKNFIVEHTLINCVLIPSQNLVWKVLTRPEDLYPG